MSVHIAPVPSTEAARQLKDPADQRWVEIADGVLDTVPKQPRHSLPIRAQFEDGTVEVSEQVVIRHRAHASDEQLHGAVLRGAAMTVDRRDNLYAITLDLLAEFG